MYVQLCGVVRGRDELLKGTPQTPWRVADVAELLLTL